MLKKVIIGSLLASSVAFGSGAADINVNNNTLEIGVEYNINRSYNLDDNSNYLLFATYLRSEEENETNNKSLVTAGVKIINPYINDYGFNFGLGIKSVMADNSSKSFMAVPLEIFVSYVINEKFHLDTSYSYAPKVLTFIDGENYREWKAKLNYKVIDNGFVYVGGREIKTSYTNDTTYSYDDAAFFGFDVRF